MKNIIIGLIIGLIIGGIVSFSIYHFTRTEVPTSTYDIEHKANMKYIDSLNTQLEIYKSNNILLLNDVKNTQNVNDSLLSLKNNDKEKIKQLQTELSKIRTTPKVLPPNELLIQLRNKFNK